MGTLASVEDLSLYIHFPYCERKCPYCDFNSHVRQRIPEEEYVRAILWRLRCHGEVFADRVVRSIFFGGGTPSLLSAGSVSRIIDGAARYFSLCSDCEITLEANPSSYESSRFSFLRSAGVNRISLGVQSFDDSSLRFLGRLHDSKQARIALEHASGIFPRLSFDLIVCLPQQSDAALKRELNAALSYGSEHLCVYQLTLEKSTEFYRRFRKGELSLPSARRSSEIYRLVEEELSLHGYASYEISSYARSPSARSRHNLVYWRYGDYVGVGPGAHGRLRLSGDMFSTLETRSPERWLRQACSLDSVIEKRWRLSAREQYMERLLMGLRLREGLPRAFFSSRALKFIDDLRLIGYCENVFTRVCLSLEGRLRLDTIVSELSDLLDAEDMLEIDFHEEDLSLGILSNG